LRFLLPILRDDFRLLETYVPREGPKLRSKIWVCCGDADPDAPSDLLAKWNEYGQIGCTLKLFSGGHFYINESRDEVVAFVRQTIQEAASCMAETA
jgi:medium-chain acyl-[acyl-carrier-protein] hydrolase